MKNKNNIHVSIQKENILAYLKFNPSGIYVDATFGRGGHSLEILNGLNSEGILISIDKDEEAKNYYEKHFPKFNNHFFIKDSFSNLKKILENKNINQVDGFLFDFGVSSPQLDSDIRGFSYKYDVFLDMRMDQNQKLTAYDVINTYPESKLKTIFKLYGDINNSFLLAKKIIEYRTKNPIKTVYQLIEIINETVPKKIKVTNPNYLSKYFQAIRIEVNDEINEIQKALKFALSKLSLNGRLVTISFHSLEERTIKKIYSSFEPKKIPKEIPLNNITNQYKIIKVNKFVSNEELEKNKRSKSSRIKVIERVSYE